MYRVLFLFVTLLSMRLVYGQVQVTEQQLQSDWGAASSNLPDGWHVEPSTQTYKNIMTFANDLNSYIQNNPNPTSTQQQALSDILFTNMGSGGEAGFPNLPAVLAIAYQYQMDSNNKTPTSDTESLYKLTQTLQDSNHLNTLVGGQNPLTNSFIQVISSNSNPFFSPDQLSLARGYNSSARNLPNTWLGTPSQQSYNNIMTFANNLKNYIGQILPNPTSQQQKFMSNLLGGITFTSPGSVGNFPSVLSYAFSNPNAPSSDIQTISLLFKTLQDSNTLKALLGHSSSQNIESNINFYTPTNLSLTPDRILTWNTARIITASNQGSKATYGALDIKKTTSGVVDDEYRPLSDQEIRNSPIDHY